jgi:hypothetical protein
VPAPVHVRRTELLAVYLPTLRANGVDLAEIPHSAHWPMYANPVAMWDRIGDFHTRHELD